MLLCLLRVCGFKLMHDVLSAFSRGCIDMSSFRVEIIYI